MLCHTKNGDIVLGEEKVKQEVISLFCNHPVGRIHFEPELKIGENYRKVILGKFLSYMILKGYSVKGGLFNIGYGAPFWVGQKIKYEVTVRLLSDNS